MKIFCRRNAGSVLTITLVITVLLGITLASYSSLVANQNLSIVRSQRWNAAIPLAEAGIEEAMAHLQKNGTNRLTDGWTLDGTNVFKERLLGDDKFQVWINFLQEPPRILARGLMQIPREGRFMNPRTVLVRTTINPLFAKGLVAKGQIDLAGNNIRTDSFDSTDPAYSDNGKYDVAKSKDNGDVATNSSLINSVNAGNADIFGEVSTGPGGSVSVGPNGAVGSKAWHAAGNNGVQPGWVKDDMNVEFPDVEVPFTGGASLVGPGNVGGTNYPYVLAGGNYHMTSLSMSSKQTLFVTGEAVLYIPGDLSMSGQSRIVLGPGAKLALYVGGSTSLQGNGVINPGSALDFSYWGLNSNTSIAFGGNAAFTGTIYAPHAHLTMGGGGNNTYDTVGAVVAKTVKMNGHFNFHYDEALGKFGPKLKYVIDSWNETLSWQEI